MLRVKVPIVAAPKVAPPTALSWPAMVLEAVSARDVPVAERKSKSTRCEVEEAVKPLVNCRSVVVAEVLRPYWVPGLKGKALKPVISPQDIVPFVVLSAWLPEQVPKFPIVVEPVLPMENSVVVEKVLPTLVEEAIAKSEVWVEDALAKSVRVAKGEEVPMPTLPAKYALPVVVAPPLMVSPPACVPLPIVEEAST